MLELLRLLRDHPGCTVSFRYGEMVGGWQAQVEKVVIDFDGERHKFEKVVSINEHLFVKAAHPEAYVVTMLTGAFEEVSVAEIED